MTTWTTRKCFHICCVHRVICLIYAHWELFTDACSVYRWHAQLMWRVFYCDTVKVMQPCIIWYSFHCTVLFTWLLFNISYLRNHAYACSHIRFEYLELGFIGLCHLPQYKLELFELLNSITPQRHLIGQSSRSFTGQDFVVKLGNMEYRACCLSLAYWFLSVNITGFSISEHISPLKNADCRNP